MMNILKRKDTIIAYLLIFMLTIGIGLILYKYPGLYEDTVVPASLGVKTIYPNAQNPEFALTHSGIAFVPNNHHGAYSAWIQMLTVLIAGGGHLLSFRLSILCIAAICNCIFYYMLSKAMRNKAIAFIAAIFLAAGINTNIFTRSQYDIMYMGAIFQLLTIYQIFLANTNSDVWHIRKRILVASILQGLAFYGYFSYLFMYPAILIWICLNVKGKERIKNFILSICGLFIGSSFYIFGFADAVITSAIGTGYTTLIVLMILACAVYVFFSIPIYIIMSGNKNKYLIIGECLIVIVSIIAMIAVFILTKDYISSKLQLMGATNITNQQKENRFLLFWIYIIQVLAGDRMSQMTGGYMVPYAGYGILLIYVISVIAFIVVSLKKDATFKAYNNNCLIGLIKILYLFTGAFYICSLPIINSMWAQHLMIAQYFIVALTALHVNAVYEICFDQIKRKIKYVICACICAFLLFLDVYENYSFFSVLTKTGGVGAYSYQLTNLCLDAYDNYMNGEKEVYVFFDWGFMEPFVYLTNNQVLYRQYSITDEEERYYINEGYDIIYCSYNSEELDNIGKKNDAYISEELKQSDGKTAIYLVHLFTNARE